MHFVYDRYNDILITQEEWEEIVRREEIDFSSDNFEEYLQENFNIKELFQMTDAEKEVVEDNYVHDYLATYDFSYDVRWTKIETISTGVEEQISEQYIQHIKEQMKS